jgi:hypothetical protein
VCHAINVSGVRFAKEGVFFYDEVVGVFKLIVNAVFPFSYLNVSGNSCKSFSISFFGVVSAAFSCKNILIFIFKITWLVCHTIYLHII